MNNKISLSYLILIIAFFLSAFREPVVKKSENASAPPVSSRHVANEKYIIDTKESVVAWKGSSVEGAQTGYVNISKGELIIENGYLA